MIKRLLKIDEYIDVTSFFTKCVNQRYSSNIHNSYLSSSHIGLRILHEIAIAGELIIGDDWRLA